MGISAHRARLAVWRFALQACWRPRRARTLAMVALLLPTLLAACAWPFGGTGPDWQQRALILIPGVCMSTSHLPPPPALPPGLPQLPASPHLPDWLTCGSNGQAVNARQRALETFGGLIGLVGRPANGPQVFRASDLRYFSYDATGAPGYAPATTQQALDASASALERQFETWHHQRPQATFDLVGHSLGGLIAALWAAHYATADDLRFVHSIVTLDSPLGGYPQPLFDALAPYLVPLFGDIARELPSTSTALLAAAQAPLRWRQGAGHYANAVFNLGNLRDVIVPAFTATLPGADGLIDDFGTGPDGLNHGTVLDSARALAIVAAVLQTSGAPVLS